MKRIKYLVVCFLAAFSLSGCNMDKYPVGSIIIDDIKTVEDAFKLRTNLYNYFRAVTSGGYISIPEIQTDMFHASITFGNVGGPIHQWTFQTNEGDVESVWAGCYAAIANANYCITVFDNMLASKDFTDAEKNQLKTYKGEAHFLRAYCYNLLAQFYCEAYDKDKADKQMGVPLQLVYAPTADVDKYPTRSSMQKTYSTILEDIAAAEANLTTAGSPDNIWLSADAVVAFKARVALNMQDYANAATYAKSLVDKGTYSLISVKGITDQDAYKAKAAVFQDMWLNDNGKESIVQFTANKVTNELPSSSSYGYISEDRVTNRTSATYIPESGVLSLYDQNNDIRFGAYFKTVSLNIGSSTIDNIVLCYKYPGNPELQYNASSNYVNKPKVFRIAEMYLIAAEGYAMSGNVTEGSKILNDLREARIMGHVRKDYNDQSELMAEIKKERQRELFAEGFRLQDLKRWGDKMQRTVSQNASTVVNEGNTTIGTLMSKEAGDPRFVWPIPKAELDSNTKLRDQQNPGY